MKSNSRAVMSASSTQNQIKNRILLIRLQRVQDKTVPVMQDNVMKAWKTPHIFNLSTRCSQVVIIKHQLLYLCGNNQFPLKRRLSGPQTWSGCSGEQKISSLNMERNCHHINQKSPLLSNFMHSPLLLLQYHFSNTHFHYSAISRTAVK